MTFCRSAQWLCGLAALAVTGPSLGAAARGLDEPDVAKTFARHLQGICQAGPRSVGSPGSRRAGDYIAAELHRLGASRVTRIGFEVVVPQTLQCELELPDGRKLQLHPLLPNGARLCTTPLEGMRAPAYYIGPGRTARMPAAPDPPWVAVMEFNSADRWQDAVMFGAAAVIFLPPDDTTWVEAHAKYLRISAAVPRFYVQQRDWVEQITERPAPVVIRSRMQWESKPAESIVAVIPGRDSQLSKRYLVLQAPFDATCVVPDLAYGAEQAVSAAALLTMAGRLAEQKPARTIVLLFAGADGRLLLGTRQVLDGLTIPRRKLQAESTDLAAEADAVAEQLRLLQDPRPQRSIRRSRDLARRFMTQIKLRLVEVTGRLRHLRRRRAAGREVSAGIEQAEADEAMLDRIHLAMRRGRWDRLKTSDRSLLGRLRQEVRSVLLRRRAELQADLARKRAAQQLQETVPFDRQRRAPIDLMLGLALSSHGDAAGLYWQTHGLQADLSAELHDQWALLVEYAKDLPDRRGFLADTMLQHRGWQGDLYPRIMAGSDVAPTFGLTGAAVATAHDGRWLIDTPLDRIDRVDIARVVAQVRAWTGLIQRAADDPRFRSFGRQRRQPATVQGRALVHSPGDSRLNLAIPGMLVRFNQRAHTDKMVGVRLSDLTFTDAEGSFRFEGLHATSDGIFGGSGYLEVVRIDEAGRIVAASDHGIPLSATINQDFDPQWRITNLRAVMFECREAFVLGLRDPRYMQELSQVQLLSQKSGQRPRSWALRAEKGAAAFFIPPQVRWQLLAGYGMLGIRMVLSNAEADHPQGRGFLGPARFFTAHRAAEDFHLLNAQRIAQQQRYGITSKLIRDSQAASGRRLSAAAAARRAGRTRDWAASSRAALSIAQRVYGRVRATANDVILGVIFLLAAIVPFSFYTERLLIATNDIYRQIAGFAVIFAIMVAVLWAFHPAFRISMTPLVVLLAFLLILLSGLVIAIVYGKFANELRKLRGRQEGRHTAGLARSEVISRAMLLGVSNMRRRRTRTVFTLTTIALITFVTLSFTSVRSYVSTTKLNLHRPPTYPGLHLQSVDWMDLPAWAEEHLRDACAGRATVAGQWWLRPGTVFDEIPNFVAVTADHRPGSGDPPGPAYVSVLMGLDAREDRFVDLPSALGPDGRDAWREFAARRDGCLIPASLAEKLGVERGDFVVILGRRFRVCGLLDEGRLAGLRYLSGQEYGPVSFQTSMQRDQVRRLRWLKGQGKTPPILRLEYRAVAPSQVVYISAASARRMGAKLHSVTILPTGGTDLGQLAEELVDQTALAMYVGMPDGVQLWSSRVTPSLGGLGEIAIPVLIAALIILNTMLGAVGERHDEIHTYTSVGLAPMHIGALFVSEAAAFATLGVAGGFILGQGFGTAATHFGWLSAISMNYGGMAAAFCMLFVAAVVILSALYPARLGARLAAPSEMRTWQLPRPENDVIHTELPFTINQEMAEGVCAFLVEWFQQHREASVGRFATGVVEVFAEPAPRDVRGVLAQVWLAPFDLGVMQTFQLEIAPTDHPQTYRVLLWLRREDGQPGPWQRLNRRFVADLRKQFLLWRVLTPEQRGRYVQASGELFAAARTATVEE